MSVIGTATGPSPPLPAQFVLHTGRRANGIIVRAVSAGFRRVGRSVLIDHLRGRPKAAVEVIPLAIARGDELWISYVVRAELLAAMRAVEEAATRDLCG